MTGSHLYRVVIQIYGLYQNNQGQFVLQKLLGLFCTLLMLIVSPTAAGDLGKSSSINRGEFYQYFKSILKLRRQDLLVFSNDIQHYLGVGPHARTEIDGFAKQLGGRSYLIAVRQVDRFGENSRAIIVTIRTRETILSPKTRWRWKRVFLPKIDGNGRFFTHDLHFNLSWHKDPNLISTTFCGDMPSSNGSFMCQRSIYRIRLGDSELLRIEAARNHGKKLKWVPIWKAGKWLVDLKTEKFE